MTSYPIWNNINSCIYKSSKSYGIKEHGEVSTFIGTSAKNSHLFLETKLTHRQHENGDREWRFYMDGKLAKIATMKKGTYEIKFIPIAE
jgi:hypothetical protein